ncbi:MAG: protein phosphatase 2C domain-containing protein, partial [Cyanobacteria bacterium P01_F01_bin.42]
DSFFLKTRPVADHQWGEQLLQGVFVLCDGMGGCDQGEVASAMATFRLTQDLLLHETPEFTADISLKSSLYKVNQDIHQENIRLRQLGLGKMGTTAVVAVLQERQMSVGHVGDSRCYCLTESKGLEQLTTDHERGQARIAQGVPESEAYASPEAFYLTQALGPMPNHRIVPDVSQIHLDEDSLFLLCSDGLSDYQVLESHGESCLAPFLDSRKDLGEAAQMLLDIGLQHNGHDNITMILVRICLP